jgi:PIN domain nuclease of toxin-antitoxin system
MTVLQRSQYLGDCEGYGELDIGSDHVVAIEDLPALHKDPFDCVLVAQAQGATRVAEPPHSTR